MQNSDEALPSINQVGHGRLVIMHIALKPIGIF